MIYNPHAHHPKCASLVLLLSMPPKTRPCDCGYYQRSGQGLIVEEVTKNLATSAAPTGEAE